jgi:S-DNA-T family DNA segregation ATPase FtsK/SpoIIIE
MPLMLITDDRYPGESIKAAARWLYRDRSELAPLALAAALWLTAAYLHAQRPPGRAGRWEAGDTPSLLVSWRGPVRTSEDRRQIRA